MKIEHFKTDISKTINWASGTSTELFVFPSDSDFTTRDFTFRLSTATVEAEETTFSSFPNITRILMILKGTLTLNHVNRYTKTLNVFEQDTFQGDWETKSKGKVTDFNLMCKNGAKGLVSHTFLKNNQQQKISLNDDYSILYVQSGSINYNGINAENGDIIVITDGTTETINISALEDTNIILSTVNL